MRFSIVTPSFNQRDFLAQTMHSVLEQHGDFELEWIIRDGGSTDGTLELLNSINDKRVKWFSEADRGQSDAINKGIADATGDVVGWLNSDDLYRPGSLAKVAKAFENPQTQWLVGRYEIIDQSGKTIRSPIVNYKNRGLNHYSYRKLLRENFIAQPAVFWRRDFRNRVGGLDESLHYTMDYDLWLRMGKQCDPVILDEVLAQFRIHPHSKSGQINREQFDEGFRVANRYFNGDSTSRRLHRFNVEKIVLAYRIMHWLGL